jgi:hypothetical protein
MAAGRDRGRWQWRQGDTDQPLAPEEIVGVRINQQHGRVPLREVLRVFRNGQGDWCAEIISAERNHILVFDYHPTVSVLGLLRRGGADIADDVLEQGAEGEDVRGRGGSR